jgi:ribosome-associated protein
LESLELAKKAAHFCADKKAENIVVLDMREIVNFCDYFVLCTATSSRHIKAVADGVDEGLHQFGIKIKFKQGLDGAGRSRSFTFARAASAANSDAPAIDESNGRWVLLDMGDVVVHVFENESREFYGLDHLWQEAVPVTWQ